MPEFEVLPVVLRGVDDAYERLRTRCDGLTDDEYHWSPAPGADTWTLRQGDDGRWHPDRPPGRREDEPVPAPVTTIAWRLWHIADCLASYVSPHLGDWPLVAPEHEGHGDAAGALADLATAHRVFRDRVGALGESGVRQRLGPAWGPFGESSWADLVVHALDEVAHHGGEIGVLRDLYLRG